MTEGEREFVRRVPQPPLRIEAPRREEKVASAETERQRDRERERDRQTEKQTETEITRQKEWGCLGIRRRRSAGCCRRRVWLLKRVLLS